MTTCSREDAGASINYTFLTSKERDGETGLDYFGARYYYSPHGRFTSADQLFEDQSEDDPQSWNLYTYVGNNPLSFTDPFGLWKWVDPGNNGNRFLQWEDGDDWHTLSSFLEKETGRFYSWEQLRSDFGSGGLGSQTIVDITGASKYYTSTKGLENKSMELYLTVLPVFRGLKAAGGLVRGIAGLFVKKEAASLATQEAANLLTRQAASKTTIEGLIKAAGELTNLKGSIKQGFVRGNPQEIFDALTKGATKLPSGAFKLADGTFVRLYKSSTSGVASIAVKTAQQSYKIRIIP